MVGAGLSKRKQVTWGAADLSWLEQVQASSVGGSGAVHLYLFYVSWRLWEAHLYVFYVSGRLRGVPPLTKLCPRVGPLKKDLTRAGGGEGAKQLDLS